MSNYTKLLEYSKRYKATDIEYEEAVKSFKRLSPETIIGSLIEIISSKEMSDYHLSFTVNNLTKYLIQEEPVSKLIQNNSLPLLIEYFRLYLTKLSDLNLNPPKVVQELWESLKIRYAPQEEPLETEDIRSNMYALLNFFDNNDLLLLTKRQVESLGEIDLLNYPKESNLATNKVVQLVVIYTLASFEIRIPKQ